MMLPLVYTLLFIGFTVLYSNSRNFISFGILFSLACAFSVHAIPYFPEVSYLTRIDNNAVIQFDKSLVGIILALFLISKIQPIKINIYELFFHFLIIGIFYFFLLKYDTYLAIGVILIDILLSALAEETLFRGLLQNHILNTQTFINWFGKFTPVFSIVFVSLIFGVAHLLNSKSIAFSIGAVIAGIIYGSVYYKTGKIEHSWLVHTEVNLCIMLIRYINFGL